jgi:hypothetical protein
LLLELRYRYLVNLQVLGGLVHFGSYQRGAI